MSLDKVKTLNQDLARINAERQKNEASREAFHSQLEQYIAKADNDHGFGLAAALAEGMPALVKRLTALHESESAKLGEQVALGEKLVQAYQTGDFNAMRKLLGQDEEVAEVIKVNTVEEGQVEASAEAPEKDLPVTETAPVVESDEEDDEGISTSSYGTASTSAPDLFAGFSNVGAAEEKEPVVAEEKVVEKPKPATLGGLSFDDDDEEPVKAGGQTISQAFANADDDDEEEKPFDFGNLLSGTDFGK